MRDTELGAAFADVWCALAKAVFSRTLDSVSGNAPARAWSTSGTGAADETPCLVPGWADVFCLGYSADQTAHPGERDAP